MAKTTGTRKSVPGSKGTPITKTPDGDIEGVPSIAVEEVEQTDTSDDTSIMSALQDDAESPAGATSPAIAPTTAPSDETPAGADSAAPASIAPTAPVQVETLRRSPMDGAIRPNPPIPNTYKGANEESMRAEVPVFCLQSAPLRIGLAKWAFEHKQTYIVPRWFALSHPRVFVIKGD